MLGRSADHADAVVQDKRLSRRHCEFFSENGVWFVRDLSSANGTRVNGAEVLQKVELKEGDELSFGGVMARFRDSEVALELEDSDELVLEDDEPVAQASAATAPVLKLLTGTLRARLFQIDKSPFTVGRRDGNDLVLRDDPQASGSHAELVQEGADWKIRDLGSTNGTRVNGTPTTDAKLSEGSRIQIGSQLFSFSLVGEQEQSSSDGVLVSSPAAVGLSLDSQGDDDELEILDDLDEVDAAVSDEALSAL
ncbi:MAG: FHA domain-containing protein, partial [Planctomycetes bacterium]|nr:FHA domain-containing protein [Planctomycetota bacterium]